MARSLALGLLNHFGLKGELNSSFLTLEADDQKKKLKVHFFTELLTISHALHQKWECAQLPQRALKVLRILILLNNL